MTKTAPLSGKWRIVEMALWDKDFLDMMEPAYIAFDGKAGGEFAFGCVTGNLHCRKAPSGSDFTWDGNDEMDPAQGRGWAVVKGDELHGMIFFHGGDDSEFVAKKKGHPPAKSIKARR